MNKILLIEDDELLRNALTELLKINGYAVFQAANGLDGVNMAKEVEPDLIICDIMMPEIDGYQVKSKLDMNRKTFVIPFIFLTAKADMSNLRKGMQLGADDYITKPFKTSDLINAVELRIAKNKRIREKPSFPKSNSTASSNKKKLNEDDHIFISSEQYTGFIRVGDIRFIKAKGNQSIICSSDNSKFYIRRTLSKWEEMLPENLFRRIRRSAIVNLNCIESMAKWSSGTFLIHLKKSDETFIVSQRYAKQIKHEIK